ncbi:hypothetical protein A2641_03805 [Candidatus Nomurabacteria bacterium RIFCSPHIGHO2_01_FULL_37_25]|uniref:D-alanyl-D-alanine carboxypeptidase-like core domain-containing protein n=1 Tax=Candidatus Nomurabacteria bacterium RIFCSPLOWO2_01_FULL_36_16 TaxID=1801767 RepID=A0A1F6WY94_9BACT|nr:MAG: hypothetical protein A2641_03805 [Candidatus Nomurabacteria bacterium RIFCSPHIGHO2_01_FULL_37_25]OGI75187.1 MAG: hypothetical protein A3D36_00960 [Candidatus Nomurabacteria bacterium RIFCSPHIGHO2_02_FULL_36_29]OGI86842.1 MAG: hypothetical protein A3A91_01170 [Candidatus Nomurabacteria bacterium RIFCSPLOWO2_01_FULL_36_16]OGI95311.1 MAG: hypothetical protein A3I84_01730 [Candidatus Nomurabacteria bacterium RIFCSPLOWO2_02_FULL_36_8]
MSVFVFILFLIPIITSSLLDLKQRIKNEIVSEQERAKKEAEDKIYLTGRFDPAQREDFVLIPSQYTLGGNKMYLRKETYKAYLEMQNAADKDGIDLKIASATRNFDYQKDIWDKKWSGVTIVDGQNLSKSVPNEQERFKKILEYSAAPSTSRHHWGTDIDINDANLGYFKTEKGKKVYEWLVQNAYQFGFCQTYNLKGSDRSTGYNEEKWHWSYFPLSRIFTQEYKNLIKEEDIKGFQGDKYVSAFNLIDDYVLAINPDCI